MKLKFLIISLISFFIFVPLTLAQTDVATTVDETFKTTNTKVARTPKAATVREETRTNIEAKKEEMTANREQKKLELTAVRKERITSRFRQMQIRIQALVERVQKLIDKIDSRIVKIDALKDTNKIDTAGAKESLALAKSKLAEVKLLVDSLSIDDTLASDTPLDTFSGVGDDVELIRTGLKEVHALLIQTIDDLKGLRVGTTNEE